MKNLQLFAALSVAALVLAACGGSSKSSTTTTTSGSGSTTSGLPAGVTPHIEAIVSHLTTYDTGSLSDGIVFQYQDLTTIQSMDQIQFQLVYYSSTGSRVVLAADQWTSSDSSSQYGNLAYNSGTYVAGAGTTPTPQIISVVYNNVVYSAPYDIVPRQVRLRGVVQSDTTHTRLSGIEVDFYGFSTITDDTAWAVTTTTDTQGNTYTVYVFPATQNPSPLVLLGKTTTKRALTPRASVPSGTYGFTIKISSIPSAYQPIYRYKGKLYNAGDVTAFGLAPIPTPSSIVTPPSTALPNPLPYPITSAISSELPVLNNYLINGEYFLANYSNTNPATNGTIQLIPTSETVSVPTY